MLGFVVVNPAGCESVVEATDYEVAGDGALVVSADRREVCREAADGWREIRPLGLRLADEWPPDNLDFLLENLYERLCVGFGHCESGGLGPVETYAMG